MSQLGIRLEIGLNQYYLIYQQKKKAVKKMKERRKEKLGHKTSVHSTFEAFIVCLIHFIPTVLGLSAFIISSVESVDRNEKSEK